MRGRLDAAPARAGHVLSAHASAVNLSWHDGRLLALHGPGWLGAPFAAALAAPARFDRLAPGTPVRRQGAAIALGALAVEWSDAALVDLRPGPAPGPAAGAALGRIAREASRGSPLAGGLGAGSRRQLAAGIARRDRARFLEGARGLIGLGPGLTPSGDDCLVGVLAVLQSREPAWLASAPRVRAAVAAAAVEGTSPVAAEFVRCALEARFAEPLTALLAAADAAGARAAAAELGRHGATSCADTLLGVWLALTALGAPGTAP